MSTTGVCYFGALACAFGSLWIAAVRHKSGPQIEQDLKLRRAQTLLLIGQVIFCLSGLYFEFSKR